MNLLRLLGIVVFCFSCLVNIVVDVVIIPDIAEMFAPILFCAKIRASTSSVVQPPLNEPAVSADFCFVA